jgi:hypothetical protein
MTDRENFLLRWSRRKLEAPEEPVTPEKPADAVPPGAPDAHTGDPKPKEVPGVKAPAEPPAFDLASLPSLDSITASTDVRGFLAPGVPSALRNMALRRAWSADPAIRDFVGLQDYDWDFNAPGGVPGFGELTPAHDVKKLLADIFGEKPTTAEIAENKPTPAAGAPASGSQLRPPDAVDQLDSAAAPPSAPPPDESIVANVTEPGRDETTLPHQEVSPAPQEVTDNKQIADETGVRRQAHGGALPK